LAGIAADGHISKPFTAEVLYHTLLKFLVPASKVEILETRSHKEPSDVKFIQMFYKQNHNICNEISGAVSAGDLDAAHRLAHNLKSNADMIKETKLCQIAQELEDSLSKHQFSTQLLDELSTEFDLVIQRITPLLEKSIPDEALASISQSEASQIFDELEILLTSRNVDALKYIDKLKTLPGTEKLVVHMENFDMLEALDALLKLRRMQKPL